MEILKENNFLASISNVIAVAIENKPGGLNSVLKILLAQDIAVKYIYSTIQDAAGEAAIMMKVSDTTKAIEALGAAKVKLFCLKDLK